MSFKDIHNFKIFALIAEKYDIPLESEAPHIGAQFRAQPPIVPGSDASFWHCCRNASVKPRPMARLPLSRVMNSSMLAKSRCAAVR
jgi:hypothetical protein